MKTPTCVSSRPYSSADNMQHDLFRSGHDIALRADFQNDRLTLQLLGYFATRQLLGGGFKGPQSITREPIAAAARARRQTKARDN